MIYCVEDDSAVRELVIYTLHATGFEAQGFPDGKAFWEAVEKEEPELVLLDIMLPGEDGISILKRLRSRKHGAGIPVIMATAKGTEFDKVTGLDLGADDYLAKPFGMMEMVSRIRAVLRRTKKSGDVHILRMGRLEVNMDEHTVCSAGTQVVLTLKEYELLKTFMEHPKRAFTRDQLLEQIWEAGYAVETRTVDVHVASLRTKLGDCGEYIKTVRGVGYRMEETE